MKITSSGKNLFCTNSNSERFLNDTIQFLQKTKTKINLVNKDHDYGYYDFDSRELTISRPEFFKKSSKTWLDLYVHEYCHFLQHYYKTPIFVKYWKPLKYIISTDKELREKSPKIIKKHLHAIRQMETECCKMSIGLIKFYDIPINTKFSSRISNAYIFYHHLVEENSTWKSKNYFTKSILSEMPTRIRSDYAIKIPKKYQVLIGKCFE